MHEYTVAYVLMSGSRRGTFAEKTFMRLVDALAFAFTRAATTACEAADIRIIDAADGTTTTVGLLVDATWTRTLPGEPR